MIYPQTSFPSESIKYRRIFTHLFNFVENLNITDGISVFRKLKFYPKLKESNPNQTLNHFLLANFESFHTHGHTAVTRAPPLSHRRHTRCPGLHHSHPLTSHLGCSRTLTTVAHRRAILSPTLLCPHRRRLHRRAHAS